MPRTGRRILLPSLLLLFLAVAIAAAVYYFVLYKPHTVTAELRVRYPQRLVTPQSDSVGNSPEELEMYAATVAELLRSRSVLFTALRTGDVKNLAVVKAQEDQESFLRNAIQIHRPTPATIEVSIPFRKGSGQEYAQLVNAVVDTFLSSAEKRDREVKSDRLQTLKKIHDQLLDSLKRDMDELELLSETLGHGYSEIPPSVATNQHFVRRTEAIIDALATEIARLKVSQIIDEDNEDADHQAKLKRLESEYGKHTEVLQNELRSLVRRSTPLKFVEVELKQRDIARLQQEVDRIAETISQAELDLETRGRIELISEATAPR